MTSMLNKKETLKDIIIWGLTPLILLLLAIFFGIATIESKNVVLIPLIQAEATIIGFFGIIVVYILKSLDDEYWGEQQRYEEQQYDSKEGDKKLSLRHLRFVFDRRIATIRYAQKIGIVLVASIFMSLLALGMADLVIAGWITIFAVYYFLMGVLSIFIMFGNEVKRSEWAYY